MKAEILKTKDGELGLMVPIPRELIDSQECPEFEVRGEAILSHLGIWKYRIDILISFAPTAAPPSEATGGLVADQSESDEQDFGYEAQMNIESPYERHQREQGFPIWKK